MEIFQLILESHLLSVLIGGFITLLSVYLAELIKSQIDRKNKKKEIYQNLKATTRRIHQYTKFVWQLDAMFAYHKRLSEIENDDFHQLEAHRRLKQSDEIKFHLAELNSEFDKLIAAIQIYIGEDADFQKIYNEIIDWQNPEETSYNRCDSSAQVSQQHSRDKETNEKYIEETLKKSLEKLNNYIKNKIK